MRSIGIFAEAAGKKAEKVTFLDDCTVLDPDMLREDEFMAQPVFNIYHSETGHDALYEESGTPGYLFGDLYDFFGLLYDEIECRCRDDADHLA